MSYKLYGLGSFLNSGVTQLYNKDQTEFVENISEMTMDFGVLTFVSEGENRGIYNGGQDLAATRFAGDLGDAVVGNNIDSILAIGNTVFYTKGGFSVFKLENGE